jgi:hypothetical protein
MEMIKASRSPWRPTDSAAAVSFSISVGVMNSLERFSSLGTLRGGFALLEACGDDLSWVMSFSGQPQIYKIERWSNESQL